MILHSYNSLNTFENCWAKNIEFGLQNEEFQLVNKNTGLPTSSFQFEKGTYDIIISTLPLTYNGGTELFFEGIPKLCGSEKDNLEMEELLGEEHIREYSLTSKTLSFFSNKLNDKDFVYIYLKKY